MTTLSRLLTPGPDEKCTCPRCNFVQQIPLGPKVCRSCGAPLVAVLDAPSAVASGGEPHG